MHAAFVVIVVALSVQCHAPSGEPTVVQPMRNNLERLIVEHVADLIPEHLQHLVSVAERVLMKYWERHTWPAPLKCGVSSAISGYIPSSFESLIPGPSAYHMMGQWRERCRQAKLRGSDGEDLEMHALSVHSDLEVTSLAAFLAFYHKTNRIAFPLRECKDDRGTIVLCWMDSSDNGFIMERYYGLYPIVGDGANRDLNPHVFFFYDVARDIYSRAELQCESVMSYAPMLCKTPMIPEIFEVSRTGIVPAASSGYGAVPKDLANFDWWGAKNFEHTAKPSGFGGGDTVSSRVNPLWWMGFNAVARATIAPPVEAGGVAATLGPRAKATSLVGGRFSKFTQSAALITVVLFDFI